MGGSVGATTDELFRGLSQSDNQASAQADLHYTYAQWYGGVLAEEVRRGEDLSVRAEAIAYLGYQRRLGDDWSAGLALRHYDYPGNPNRTRYDYDEFAATLGWRERVSVNIIASPDTYAFDYQGHYGSGAAYCYELALREPLPLGLAANAGVGYYDLRREIGSGYGYWSAGLERQWRGWDFDLRYVGTDSAARYRFRDEAANRVVAGAFWSF